MNFFKFEKVNIIASILAILIFVGFAILYSSTTIFTDLENASIDFKFFLRAPSERVKDLKKGVTKQRINKKARKDIMILGIDEATIRYFSNLDKKVEWPYPWNIHAKITKFLATGDPLAIVFDVMFLDHKDYEKEFATVIKNADNVLLDYPFETKKIDVQYNDIKERINTLKKVRFPVNPDDNSSQLISEPTPPLPSLTKASEGIGFANVFPGLHGRDNVVRKMPLILKYNNWYYPNIDLIIAMHYYGITKNDVEIKMGQYIKLKNVNRKKMAKPNKEGVVTIPIDENGFLDINFVGGAGSFQHLSYYMFNQEGSLEGNDSIKGKIILIAMYVQGVAHDIKESPYGATFGIEHHANTINTILNQDFLNHLSDFQNILFTVFLLGGYFIGAFVLFDSFNVIVATATPLSQIAVTFTLIITYKVFAEQKQKKQIRQTFSKFVSKSVVDELLKDPDKIQLGGENKRLTVLFSDIRSFTSLSEKLTPQELVHHLNEYLEAMTDLIIKEGGTLDKYVGDEVMAFWGAPLPQENHAFLACKSALEQMEKLRELNEKWKSEGKYQLNIGIGLNSGDMVVGNMGSSSRMDYTLMGDNVNLGARLEGTNKIYKTNIIISEYTYEEVKDQVIVRELDLIRVKGKVKPVRIYELIDLKES